ncbi:MAG: hypothetical protein WKF42_09145 [Solirubrobacteraceae bacterium]
MADRTRSLLELGHEDEWARLEAEKRRELTPLASTPIHELLCRGQVLSAQAAMLARAVSSADERTPT